MLRRSIFKNTTLLAHYVCSWCVPHAGCARIGIGRGRRQKRNADITSGAAPLPLRNCLLLCTAVVVVRGRRPSRSPHSLRYARTHTDQQQGEAGKGAAAAATAGPGPDSDGPHLWPHLTDEEMAQNREALMGGGAAVDDAPARAARGVCRAPVGLAGVLTGGISCAAAQQPPICSGHACPTSPQPFAALCASIPSSLSLSAVPGSLLNVSELEGMASMAKGEQGQKSSFLRQALRTGSWPTAASLASSSLPHPWPCRAVP